jgi:hypothetical protein
VGGTNIVECIAVVESGLQGMDATGLNSKDEEEADFPVSVVPVVLGGRAVADCPVEPTTG